jgi:GAF domain-containing protein
MANVSGACAYLEAVRETTHALSSVLLETEVIQVLLDHLAGALSTAQALVLLLNPDGNGFTLGKAIGLSEAYLSKMPLGMEQSRFNQRLFAGESVSVADVAEEPEFHHAAQFLESSRRMTAVPLSVRGHIVGAIHLYSETQNFDDPETMSLLWSLADLGAAVLEKVRLRQSLYRIAEALNASSDLEQMLQRVLEAAVKEMWMKGASIRLLGRRGRTLRLIASHGLSETYLGKGEVHVAKSGIDVRVLAGETVVLHDLEHDSGFEYPREAAKEGIRSILAVPLKLKDRKLGVMRVHAAVPRHFGPVAITFLQSVADLVSLAIENAELYAALQARYKDLKLDLADWQRFLALG